jgi:hypothetical protein
MSTEQNIQKDIDVKLYSFSKEIELYWNQYMETIKVWKLITTYHNMNMPKESMHFYATSRQWISVLFCIRKYLQQHMFSNKNTNIYFLNEQEHKYYHPFIKL